MTTTKNKAITYARAVVNKKIEAPKYVIKQCADFLNIADGKNEKYVISKKKTKQIEQILKLLNMPKGLKAGQSLYECATSYQWLLYISALAVVYRENHEKRRYETVILEIGRKNFKALSLDTPIPTPSGWRTMGEISVGDYIFTQNGKPTKVIGQSEIFNKPMYLVEFEDGEKIKASCDHIWTVSTKNSKRTASRNSRHIGTGKLYSAEGWYDTTTEEMASDFVRERKDGKGREYKYRVPMNGAVEYSEKDLPIDPYLLGVWLGNGCRHNSTISVGKTDAEEMLKNLSACGYPVDLVYPKDKSPIINVDRRTKRNEKTDNSFIVKMRKLGLINNKHIPRIYLEASIEQRMELLRGLMDTDGSCSLAGECSFIQKSPVLSENVLELINSLGIKAKKIKRKAFLNGKDMGDVYFISFWVDKNNSCFKYERKKARLKEKLAGRMGAKSIVNITPIEAEPSKCIMVEDPSHLYLAGKQFTVTHNTYTVGTLFIILFLTEPQFSKFFSVAPDGSLSREVREAIAETLKASPLIYEHNGNKRFKILRDYISCTLNSNKYIPLNYSTSRLDGRLPQVFVADEVGALPNSYAIDAMRSGQLNILNKLGCIISTKYPTIDNPFETEVDYAKKVLDGIVKDETIFALLYEPDDTINWATNDLVLKHANPAALENPVIWEDLLKKRAYAIAVPSARSNFCCKHCNISMQDEAEAYIEVSAVQKCRRAEPIDWTGRDVWLAMDLAVTTDNCAVAMVSEENGEILAETWAFIPEGRIDEKNTIEKINYNDFIRNGKCFACGDRTVDYKFIEDFIIGIEEKYGVVIQSIGYDRYNALSSAQKLDEAGYNVVEIKQHSSVLHPATKLLKEKILEGEFEYSNNPLLEINFQNARCLYDTNLNAYVAKKRSAGKVDEVVALINAVCLLQRDVVFGESTAPIQII